MKIKWIKVWEREYSLTRMQEVQWSFSTPYARKLLGFNIKKTLLIQLPNRNAGFYADSVEWPKLIKKIRSIFEHPKAFRKYYKEYQRAQAYFLETSRSLKNFSYYKLDNKQLAALLEKYIDANNQFMMVGQWTTFLMAEAADEVVRKLAKRVSPQQPEKFINTVLTPIRFSQIRLERIRLLKIALEKNWTKMNKLLLQHVQRFEWIPCINVFDPPPWDRKFFEKQLKQIKNATNAKKELNKIIQTFRESNKDFRVLLRKERDPYNRQLMKQARLVTFLKDDRDDTRRQAYFNVRLFYMAFGKRLKLNQKELMLITNQELVNWLLKGQTISKKILTSRNKGYAVVYKNNSQQICTDKEYRKYLSLLSKHQESSVFKGLSASKGKIRGKVVIVPGAFDLKKMKSGRVLVTVVTHPDFLPAMRVARAIVTDEGGLTSHAAIVARELGIPCIVGTKIATKVFKDGDLVEVDAKRGIVKILKKAK